MNELTKKIKQIEESLALIENQSNNQTINAANRIERTLKYWCQQESFFKMMTKAEFNCYINNLYNEYSSENQVTKLPDQSQNNQLLVDRADVPDIFFEAMQTVYLRRIRELAKEDPTVLTEVFKNHCCHAKFAENMSSVDIIEFLNKLANSGLS